MSSGKFNYQPGDIVITGTTTLWACKDSFNIVAIVPRRAMGMVIQARDHHPLTRLLVLVNGMTGWSWNCDWEKP